jgi:hypothetical protein
MQVSDSSHERLESQSIVLGTTGEDSGPTVEDCELWDDWSRTGNSSQSIRNLSTAYRDLAKDTIQATPHGTKRSNQTYREDSMPSAQPSSSAVQVEVNNTSTSANSCSDVDQVPEVRQAPKGPRQVKTPESKKLLKKKAGAKL